MKTKCQYNHTTCNKIDAEGGAQGGAGVIILLNEDHILLGYDNYLKSYAICTGKRSVKETCYIEAIEREALEEFKICISALESTNKNIFCDENENFIDSEGNVKFIVVGRSPIFIGRYAYDEINVDSFNKKIESDNQNEQLPPDFKEINHLKVCFKNSIKKVDKDSYTIMSEDNKILPLSKFTYKVLTTLNNKNKLIE